MISFKKSYAEQLLQLALALSLLQVDPENYLGRGWDSQLEFHRGNAWELEMLHAVPLAEFPYSNRKAMMPLIEDLVRFDRQANNFRDVTAYLLNVQNGQSNQTAAAADLESNTANSAVGGGGAVAIESPSLFNSSAPIGPEIDIFMNSEHFQDQASILDQNLADLSDFGDIPISQLDPYHALPLKDESFDNLNQMSLLNIKTEHEEETITDDSGFPDGDRPKREANDTERVVTWSDFYNVSKTEPDSGYEEEDTKPNLVTVKNEPIDDDGDDFAGIESPFISQVELTKQESEIVEVLWKQDVDLGYSLSPSKAASGAGDGLSTNNSDDENEKLKALADLKNEQSKDNDESDLDDDEWTGIPFTIDNETGEYIRLPLQLDELLQDVLNLADFASDDTNNEFDPIASTSKFPIKNDSEPSEGSNRSPPTDGSTAAVEPPQSEVEISSLPSPIFDLENVSNELNELDMMIQSAAANYHHQHPRAGQNYAGSNAVFRQSSTGFHHQPRVPLSRGVSMEQRLQDIASLFNPIPGMGVGMGVGDMSPYPHYPAHYPYQGAPQHGQFPHPSHHSVLHNASLGDLNPSQPHYGHNLGSAVSSSMHLTNSSHESDNGTSGFKMEHEMMYYSNASSELNHTTDGFINSILNDEDLHLMDMNVGDNYCSMRMLDANTTSNNSSVLGPPSGASGGGSHGGNHHMAMHNSLTTSGIVGGNSMGTDGLGSTTADRLDASSDSAVSSMGSERVPSLSDGEWGEGSDSAQDYHQGKYGGPYDYSYNSRLNDGIRQPPVAQKKHQMFGKRYFQEQPTSIPQANPIPHVNALNNAPVKYEYEPYAHLHHHSPAIGTSLEGAVGPALHKENHSINTNSDIKYSGYLDFSTRPPRNVHEVINHNHTYSLPQGTGSIPRPQLRDKKIKKAEDEHLSRDEKRARSLNIPISVNDIINLPMDEFNERLSKYDLTENQLSLIRDIRRRGKNKVAAQNCRKRKLDQIVSLEDEVKEVRRRKDDLYHERDMIITERKRITNKFAALHRHIFHYLRDSEGNPCSPNDYSLQQASDGSVYLLRRDGTKPDGSSNSSNTNTTNSHHPNQGPPSHQHHPHHRKE